MDGPQESGLLQRLFQQQQADEGVSINIDSSDVSASSIDHNGRTSCNTQERLPDENSHITRESVSKTEYGMVFQETIQQIEVINDTLRGMQENVVNIIAPVAPTSTTSGEIHDSEERIPDETSQESVFESEYDLDVEGTITYAPFASEGSENRVVEMPDLSKEAEQMEEINETLREIQENIVNMVARFTSPSTTSASFGNEHRVGDIAEVSQVIEQIEDSDYSSQIYDNRAESEYEISLTTSSSSSNASGESRWTEFPDETEASENDNTSFDGSEQGILFNFDSRYTFSEDSEEEGDVTLFLDIEYYESTNEILEEMPFRSTGEFANEPIVIGAFSSSATVNPVPSDENTQVAPPHKETLQKVNDAHEANVTAKNRILYDTNLPTEHLYLGSNMTRVPGVNYFEANQECMITLFLHRCVVFPGEVLPFVISREILETCRVEQNGLMVGVCFDGVEMDDYYGVTCQVFESGPYEAGSSDKLFVKVCAWQRFVVKKIQITGKLQCIDAHQQSLSKGLVKILPDIYLPDPLENINMGSMSRFRDIDSLKQMYRRFQAAGTPWPSHFFDKCNMSNFIERAREFQQLQQLGTMPDEPVRLSFWLGRNLPLLEGIKLRILIADCVHERIKWMSVAFTENAIFICDFCENYIAICRFMMAMSKYGALTHYCNPGRHGFKGTTIFDLPPTLFFDEFYMVPGLCLAEIEVPKLLTFYWLEVYELKRRYHTEAILCDFYHTCKTGYTNHIALLIELPL